LSDFLRRLEELTSFKRIDMRQTEGLASDHTRTNYGDVIFMPNKLESSKYQSPVIACTPKRLHPNQWIQAAQKAVQINPVNHAPVQRLSRVIPGFIAQPEHIAVLTTKYWGAQGVRLTVGFLDNPEAALRRRILEHMNAWNTTANVLFVETSGEAQVRIARQDGANGGFWSFLGTDILSIEEDQPTMNLEGFTMETAESEFHRVIRHETGHTMGFPHEHMRQELVDKIDPVKAIEFFGETQGWSPEEVRQQVLTPLEKSSLLGTPNADPNSIMCYQIPGSITKDGQPIVGGLDIDPSDFTFAAKIYPKLVTGSSVDTTSAATSAGSAAVGVGATVLDFSGGQLIRITLNHPASSLPG
jgi:hypothetical protein